MATKVNASSSPRGSHIVAASGMTAPIPKQRPAVKAARTPSLVGPRASRRSSASAWAGTGSSSVRASAAWRESRVQALGLVNSDEFLEFAGGIRLDARPFRFEQRTAHLPLGPDLAVAGSCRRGSAGQDDRCTGRQQGPGRRARADKPSAMPAADVVPSLTSGIDARALSRRVSRLTLLVPPPPSSQGSLNHPVPAPGRRGVRVVHPCGCPPGLPSSDGRTLEGSRCTGAPSAC